MVGLRLVVFVADNAEMKVPLPNGQLLAIEAPVLPAYAVKHMGSQRLFAWCKYCRDWHIHGAGEGHREAHCSERTPYSASGYNLALRGVMSRMQARLEKERQLRALPE